jgi:hypothetical protein
MPVQCGINAGMSVASIWIAGVFTLAICGIVVTGVARWRRSRGSSAILYRRAVPQLQQPIAYRERGLRNLPDELARSDEWYGPG